jgi:hypothetical protein
MQEISTTKSIVRCRFLKAQTFPITASAPRPTIFSESRFRVVENGRNVFERRYLSHNRQKVEKSVKLGHNCNWHTWFVCTNSQQCEIQKSRSMKTRIEWGKICAVIGCCQTGFEILCASVCVMLKWAPVWVTLDVDSSILRAENTLIGQRVKFAADLLPLISRCETVTVTENLLCVRDNQYLNCEVCMCRRE